MDLKKNSKEVIKGRLKKSAVKLWGYQEADADEFDPVVDLLFGACAFEFERLSTEVYISQKRILEKVSQILLPEVFLSPVPSYAMMNGKPISPEKFTEQTDQFVFEREIPGKSSDKPEKKKLYFSPVPGFRLTNAEVAFLATTNEVIQLTDVLNRKTTIRSEIQDFPTKNQLWLGIKIDPSVDTLKYISFYFDWMDSPDKEELLKLLHLSNWFSNHKPVDKKQGFNELIDSRFSAETVDINSYLDLNLKTEKRTCDFFENHFVTITENFEWIKERYPDEFLQYYSDDQLKVFTEEICWIEIRFPEIFPVTLLSSTFVSVNAFPVINRRLHDSNRPHTLNKDLNILPLISDDFFFTIRKIISSNQINYQEVPFKKINDFAPGTYTIRTDGVKRFDDRDAYDYVQYLLELLHEEYIAFESMGSSLIAKELSDLQIIINRLQLNVKKTNGSSGNTHFVILRSDIVEDIWLEFWSTSGKLANNVPYGTTCTNTDFDKKSLRLLTTSVGGKNPPDQVERIAIFKNELLTRNRIVTKEDIKAACFAELGNDLKEVEISTTPILSSNRNIAFQNGLHVILHMKDEKSDEEKKILSRHMEKVLQQRSSCIYRYLVEAAI